MNEYYKKMLAKVRKELEDLMNMPRNAKFSDQAAAFMEQVAEYVFGRLAELRSTALTSRSSGQICVNAGSYATRARITVSSMLHHQSCDCVPLLLLNRSCTSGS